MGELAKAEPVRGVWGALAAQPHLPSSGALHTQHCLRAPGPCPASWPWRLHVSRTLQHCSLKPWGPGQSQAEASQGEEVRPQGQDRQLPLVLCF